MIAMPPRHGKSFFTSQYFPAWFLGTYPDKRVILCSYEADFAASWGRKVRDALEEFGEETFGIRIASKSSAADRWDIEGHFGGMNTAGVGGPITGKGADLLIIDDPIKNAEEANSDTIRARHKDWWRSTAYTRIEPGGAAVIMNTRWHEEDLSGWLLSEMKDGGEPWEQLTLSAIAEDNDPLGRQPGQALWPERYDEATLQQTKKVVGSYWFSALYQGRPQPAEGNKFKRPWFRYWTKDDEIYRLHGGPQDKVVLAKDCRRFGTVDLAVSTKLSADYTVIASWAVTPEADLILLDLVRERLEEPDLIRAAIAAHRRNSLEYLTVEANGTQLGIVQTMRRGRVENGVLVDALPVRESISSEKKETRASTAIVRCEAGQIYFPANASWLGDYENELLSFPTGAHDDMVDVTSLAAIDVFKLGAAPETPDQAKARKDAAELAARLAAEERDRRDRANANLDRWFN